VEQNPYQSPEPPKDHRITSGCVTALFLIVAGVCWLFGLAYAASGIAYLLFMPVPAELLRDKPHLFAVTTVCSIISPVAGLMALGLASWRRSVRWAALGAAFLVPFALFVMVKFHFYYR
jgi:hypothetical protein